MGIALASYVSMIKTKPSKSSSLSYEDLYKNNWRSVLRNNFLPLPIFAVHLSLNYDSHKQIETEKISF